MKRLAKTFESCGAASEKQLTIEELDPRSEATSVNDWYDTREQLDEAELARFLDDFDQGAQVSASGSVSVSTGAEPFVTVADSTLANDLESARDQEDEQEDNTLNDENDHLLSSNDDENAEEDTGWTEVAAGEQGKELVNNCALVRGKCEKVAMLTSERVIEGELESVPSWNESGLTAAENGALHQSIALDSSQKHNNKSTNIIIENSAEPNEQISLPREDHTLLTPQSLNDKKQQDGERISASPSATRNSWPPQSQTDEAAERSKSSIGDTEVKRLSQVDDSFRDSLNLIIGQQRRPTRQMVVSVSSSSIREPPEGKEATELSDKKDLKKLTRYYRDILRLRRARGAREKRDSPKADLLPDYIHSSDSSSSSEGDESESEGSDSEAASGGPREARKCSLLQEELERILARKIESSSPTNNNNNDPDEYYYEGSLSSALLDADRASLSSSSVSCESLPEIRQRQNLQKLYNIVKEIHSSEAKFVDTLKLLNVELRAHMTPFMAASPTAAQQAESLMLLLRHLPQLQALNESLLEELARAMNEWPRTRKIAHVLVKIGPFLKHYSTYIRDFDSLQQQLAEAQRKNPQLAERIRVFEAHDRCQRLSIQHHFLKPIQRIPQYRLLLQQYLHYLKPDDLDYEDTVSALEVVSRVAEHANQAMNEGANFAKLLALQAKIVGKQRDIVQPGRLFVREGELMKVCRKQVQPRWFVLLSDALLYLTQIQSSDILYLNNELPLDDCQVSTPSEQQANLIGQQFDTELTVCTRARSFALVAKSREERDRWVADLRRTIDEHLARKRSFSTRSSTLR